MNTQNLHKSARLALELQVAVREAHTDAVNTGDRRDEFLLFETIEPAVELAQRLSKLQDIIERRTDRRGR